MTDTNMITVLGFVAGALTAVSMLPQLIKTIKEKKAEQVSILMLIVLISGISLWVWYGYKKNDWPLLITNSFSLLINTCLIYFRIKYKDNE